MMTLSSPYCSSSCSSLQTNRYSNKLDCQKALSRNGKLIGDGLMIGVLAGVQGPVGEARQQRFPLLQQQQQPQQFAVLNTKPKGSPIALGTWWHQLWQYFFGG
jgi:hypothetical protein